MNEEALEYINNHDELWCTYCWVMFDFAVDARNEGGQIALNDKGLVTADRQIKKDSFYLNVTLEVGKVEVKVVGTCEGDARECTDTCTWNCKSS